MFVYSRSFDVSALMPLFPSTMFLLLRLLRSLANLLNLPVLLLLFSFFDDPDFVEKFKLAPAAKKMHHAYLGGLLEHSLSMGLLADKISCHYKGINADLIKAAAILHDMGKIYEFNYEFSIDYSHACYQ